MRIFDSRLRLVARGADGVVVTSDVKKINDLQGKVLAASQFTESDFFIRYLAGEAKVGEMKLSLKSLSKARCAEVKQILQEKLGVDESRIETQGVGADEPTGNGPDADRRVEVQWFTVE
jgi:hypothetical protein